MPIFESTDGTKNLTPADYGQLIINPVQAESVAFQVSNIIETRGAEFHAPVITEDGGAKFAAEGEDLTGDATQFAELTVRPAKVGAVQLVSAELAADSSPEASALIGQSIARGIAKAVDKAFFGQLAAPAPQGLGYLADVTEVSGQLTNLDAFTEAITKAEQQGAVIKHFAVSPEDFAALLKLKKGDKSNEPLLGTDATEASVRTILGVPVIPSAALTTGTAYGIDPRFSLAVRRQDVAIEMSREAYFSTDQVAVKATMRVAFGFPHHRGIVRLNLGANAAAI